MGKVLWFSIVSPLQDVCVCVGGARVARLAVGWWCLKNFIMRSMRTGNPSLNGVLYDAMQAYVSTWAHDSHMERMSKMWTPKDNEGVIIISVVTCSSALSSTCTAHIIRKERKKSSFIYIAIDLHPKVIVVVNVCGCVFNGRNGVLFHFSMTLYLNSLEPCSFEGLLCTLSVCCIGFYWIPTIVCVSCAFALVSESGCCFHTNQF